MIKVKLTKLKSVIVLNIILSTIKSIRKTLKYINKLSHKYSNFIDIRGTLEFNLHTLVPKVL